MKTEEHLEALASPPKTPNPKNFARAVLGRISDREMTPYELERVTGFSADMIALRLAEHVRKGRCRCRVIGTCPSGRPLIAYRMAEVTV